MKDNHSVVWLTFKEKHHLISFILYFSFNTFLHLSLWSISYRIPHQSSDEVKPNVPQDASTSASTEKDTISHRGNMRNTSCPDHHPALLTLRQSLYPFSGKQSGYVLEKTLKMIMPFYPIILLLEILGKSSEKSDKDSYTKLHHKIMYITT